MKRKTFFATLILFLFFFNLCIFIVSSVMFKDTINHAKEKSLGEHYFIISSLMRDFHAVESRGIDIQDSISSILQPYTYLIDHKKTAIALYKDNQLLYANKNIEQEFLQNQTEDENREISVRKFNNKTYVYVSGNMPVPYDSYTFVHQYDLTESIDSWSQLKNILFLVSFILSNIFACGLFLILNFIFKPLSQITHISREIAKGEYEKRLPVIGQDELAEMAKSFNDMAEEIERKVKQLKDAAEKKQQFVDNFAHELRTPLTAIYGYAEYMQKAALSEEDRLSSLEYIMSESRRLQTIAAQLLEMANLKNYQISFEEVKISQLFENVQRTLHGRLQGKDIKIEFKSEIETVLGDAPLLESLFVNLIDNAINACDDDGHIIVSAVMENERKTISVKDNGKGMAQEVLSQITEPFYRGDKSRSRSDGGAGLGLAICQQIALSHHADLTFMSNLGKGTVVKVIFTTS